VRTEDGARQAERVERTREGFGIAHPWRTEQLERLGGAAALRDVEAFEQHGARIDDFGLERGNVRRGQHERQSRLVEIHLAAPALHGDDFELRAQTESLVEQPRQLADRHAVPHGQLVQADERLVAFLEHRSFDGDAADRIGPIADNHRQASSCRGLQAVGRRVNVGINAGADILQVDDKRIEPCEHLVGGFARFAVQGIDRDPATVVAPVRRLDHVFLHVRPDAVLRSEERTDGHAAGGRPIDRMPERGVDRRRIADQSDAAPLEEIFLEQDVGAEGNGHD
jgi:hypothetical protein